MVYAVGIEVFCHFVETLHPPGIAVFLHDIPVVGGKAPVLPVHGEIIGRCAGLAVQVEVVGFLPGFHTVAADADGDVAFQHYAVGARMLRGGKQLPVQVELDVIIDGYVRIVGGVRPAQCLYLFGIVGGILGPLVEIRGLVGITQVAEDGIWLQPFLVGLVEITECIRGQHLFPFLLEDEVEVFPLCLVHSFVVHGGQGIQFLLAFVEFGHHLLVLQAAQLLQVGVHGMEGIDGDATVRVGVCPGMRHGSVVDGQNLHRLLIGGNCPVNHALQVAEIAYTEAFLGA